MAVGAEERPHSFESPPCQIKGLGFTAFSDSYDERRLRMRERLDSSHSGPLLPHTSIAARVDEMGLKRWRSNGTHAASAGCRFGDNVQTILPSYHDDTTILCKSTWGAASDEGGQPVTVALNEVSFATLGGDRAAWVQSGTRLTLCYTNPCSYSAPRSSAPCILLATCSLLSAFASLTSPTFALELPLPGKTYGLSLRTSTSRLCSRSTFLRARHRLYKSDLTLSPPTARA